MKKEQNGKQFLMSFLVNVKGIIETVVNEVRFLDFKLFFT